MLFDLGTTFEFRLKDLAAAEQAYGRASRRTPEPPSGDRALRAAQRTGADPEALSRRLEHWAELAGDPRPKAGLMRAGLLQLERTRPRECRALFRRCAASECAGPLGAAAAERGLRGYGSKRGAGGHAAAAARDHARRAGSAALRCRIGWLLHNRLQDPEGAVAAYRGALAVLPGYLPALQALGTIFRQQQDFERLVAVTVAETEGAAESPAVRASRYLEAAESLLDELGRPTRRSRPAGEHWNLIPGMPAATAQLVRLLERENAGPSSPSCMARGGGTTDDRTGTGCCSRWRGCSPGPSALRISRSTRWSPPAA